MEKDPNPKPTPKPDYAALRQGFDADARVDWLALELAGAYHRPTGARVDYAEAHALAEVCRRPAVKDELKIILAYRDRLPDKDRKFFPQSMSRLLAGWQEVLDRARNHFPEKTIIEKDIDRELRRASL